MTQFGKDNMPKEDNQIKPIDVTRFTHVFAYAAQGKTADRIDRIVNGAKIRAIHEDMLANDSSYKENFEQYSALIKTEDFTKLKEAMDGVSSHRKRPIPFATPSSIFKAFSAAIRHHKTLKTATKCQDKAIDTFTAHYKPDKPDAPKM